MTPQDIERIAREAGIHPSSVHQDPPHIRAYSQSTPEQLAKFAALVLEDAAKVCDERQDYDLRGNHIEGAYSSAICATRLRTIAASLSGKDEQ
jgi:hypothetical protein